jgi:hypothetical protein
MKRLFVLLAILVLRSLALGQVQPNPTGMVYQTPNYNPSTDTLSVTGLIATSPTFSGPLSGTSATFTGNVTIGGQIIGTGPWQASGPVPGVTLTPAINTSQLAFDANGLLVASENDGSVLSVAKFSTATAPLSKGVVGTDSNGHLTDASANYQTAAAAQAAYSGIGSTANRVVTGLNANAAPTTATVTSAYVDTSICSNAACSQNTTGTSANVSGTPLLPNGTTAATQTVGDNSQKLATTAYVRAENYSTWSCLLPSGYYSAVLSYCNWTIPTGVTVKGVDLSTNGAPTSCTTTYPVLQLWDGTSGGEIGVYSFTLDNATLYYVQVTGSAAVTSGHVMRVRVVTPSSGCTGNAYQASVTVTYQMTN